MDKYVHDYRMQLRLAEQSMRARRLAIEKRPVGMLLRRNQATHITALINLLVELRVIAAHDEETWWENEEELPF